MRGFLLLSVVLVSAAEYSSLGCWRNKIPQQMTKLEGSDERLDKWNYKRRDDAINKCHVVARDQGYAVFAVGNSGQCWAGSAEDYQKYGQPSSCPENGKGSYGVIHVYSIAPPTTTPAPTTIPEECGGHIWEQSGTIRSPGYPNKYPTDRQCSWVIYATDNQPIRIKVSDFNLEHHIDCNYDYLELRNGGSPRSPLIGKFCGDDAINTFSSSSDAVFIRFVSDSLSTHPGFSLTFDADNTCYNDDTYGENYNGTMVTTQSGTLCQRWDMNTPHKVSYKYTKAEEFPEEQLAEAGNYCRNPAVDGDLPWCYTTDPDTRWEYCGIPTC